MFAYKTLNVLSISIYKDAKSRANNKCTGFEKVLHQGVIKTNITFSRCIFASLVASRKAVLF